MPATAISASTGPPANQLATRLFVCVRSSTRAQTVRRIRMRARRARARTGRARSLALAPRTHASATRATRAPTVKHSTRAITVRV